MIRKLRKSQLIPRLQAKMTSINLQRNKLTIRPRKIAKIRSQRQKYPLTQK